MKRILILCAVALFAQLPARAEGPRIGILSDAGSRKEADLLLVELQKAKCELVERDEIAKVVNEQALQAGLNRAESLRIGQMLKADGLILITRNSDELVDLRLVAVAPGLVVLNDEWPLNPGSKGKPWPVLAALRLGGCLPKLLVKPGDAVPVSVMRLRPQTGTFQALGVANHLTRLLVSRLTHESALFVLERENLRQMSEEQRWAGSDPSFWAGSHMLQGQVEVDPITSNSVRVIATVTGPPAVVRGSKVMATNLVVNGTIAELPAMTERLVTQVLPILSVKPASTGWNAATEAEAFRAMAWQYPRLEQSRAFLETAVALGSSKAAYDYLQVVSSLAEGNQTPKEALANYAYYDERVLNVLNATQVKYRATKILEALEFARSYCPPGGFSPATERKWLQVCISGPDIATPFNLAGQFLAMVHQAGRQEIVEEQFNQIRVAGRELAWRYFNNPDCWREARSNMQPGGWLRYFFDSTAEILTCYRALWGLNAPLNSNLPEAPRPNEAFPMLDPRAAEPGISAKPAETPTHREALWGRFLTELDASKFAEHRILLARYRLREAKSEQEARKQRLRLHEALVAWAGGSMAKKVGYGFSMSMGIYEVDLLGSAYPGFQCRDGKFYRFQGRDASVLTSTEDIREQAARARELFETLLPKEAILSQLVVPYLAAYTKEEASQIFALTRQAEPKLPAKGQAKELLEAIVKQFPMLADQTMQTEASAEAAAKLKRLKVTQVLTTNYTMRDPNLVWHKDRLWYPAFGGPPQPMFCGLNTQTRQFEFVTSAHNTVLSHMGVTDSFWVSVVNRQRAYMENEESHSSLLGVRKHSQPDWQTKVLPFCVYDTAEVQGQLYAIVTTPFLAPNRTIIGIYGIVRFDFPSLQSTIILDPSRSQKTAPTNSPPAGFYLVYHPRLAASATELFLKTVKTEYLPESPRFHAWNPKSNQWRVATPAEWQTVSTDADRYQGASETFGFTTIRLDADFMNEKVTPHLVVKRVGSAQEERIPLDCTASPHGAMIPTPTSVLCTLRNRSGFLDIPYSDIQQWLAANPPAADKPALPVAPMPKGK